MGKMGWKTIVGVLAAIGLRCAIAKISPAAGAGAGAGR